MNGLARVHRGPVASQRTNAAVSGKSRYHEKVDDGIDALRPARQLHVDRWPDERELYRDAGNEAERTNVMQERIEGVRRRREP